MQTVGDVYLIRKDARPLRNACADGGYLPARAGIQRLIFPYEYRHLRVFGVGRIAGGSVAAAAGVVCLWYGVYGWAAFLLAVGALNFASGSWYPMIARSASARPEPGRMVSFLIGA